MPEAIKSEPFSDIWWSEFIENSGNMTHPVVVEDSITDDVQNLKESIYEMLQNLKYENDPMAWRIWVDGKKVSQKKKTIIDDPITGESDLLSWQERNFQDKKFGIILNNAQRYSEKSRQFISNYFKPFLDKKPPFGGINFSVFIGNYGWTPIGIHEDHTGSFVMHFHLGPGDKTMYMWERSKYKEQLNGNENDMNPEDYIPFADYTCEFKTGDVFFMPWNYYHVGKSDDLSLALTVWFNYTTVDGLLNGVWESGMKELMDEKSLNDQLIPNIKNIKDDTAIDYILSQLEEEIVETSINDFISEQLEDYSDALKSNNWYDNGTIKNKKNNVELNKDSMLKINKSSIICKRSGESVNFFHRGDKISFHYHDDMKKLVSIINKGDTIPVEKMLDDLFVDWPKGIGTRLLEILCENDILKVIED